MTLTSTTEEHQVDAQRYLKDLQKLVTSLEDDLRVRSRQLPEVHDRLTREYNQAKSTERTLDTYETWLDNYLTQVAVAWVLSGVFLRYLEDNQLIDEVWLAGGGDRLVRAQDRHQHYFQKNPTHTDREYFEEAFRNVAALPGCRELFGEERNPLWLLGPTGDMAKELLAFWQAIEPETGNLVRTFGDPTKAILSPPSATHEWVPVEEGGTTASTRFLGDLYQDLSESARKRYALLQTPDFVEEFILDRTLDPALSTFGLEQVRMLDPTCGSGHFLLGGFQRLLKGWRDSSPNLNERERVRRALDGVYGVDINPFAVAIARFRLLVAALRACGIRRLKDAPGFKVHVAAGDSLLHGRRFDREGQYRFVGRDWLPEAFAQGDFEEASEILSRQYHAVVGNPPYIVDKDRAHNAEVRQRYSSCHQKFSLAVPFKELFFEKVVSTPRAGYVGVITANSFMKREFGKKLIEEFFPTVDLTHVIDTSGAYIPGHGTPTVILFGRSQSPRREVVRAALGIRGEPATPDDASQGKVWRSIVDNLERPGVENEFVTIGDIEREKFHQHPWSLSGGGATELKEVVEGAALQRLGDLVDSIGFTSFTGHDEVFVADEQAFLRQGIGKELIRQFVYGQCVRDWSLTRAEAAFVPYSRDFQLLEMADSSRRWCQYLWKYRTNLENVQTFGGKTRTEAGNPWWGWYRWIPDKLRIPLSITFAFVATHNHFVLDRGGKVFNRTAPVIKLPEGAGEEEHLALLGLLNSSVACFWLKQVCTGKHKGDGGTAHATPEYQRYEFDGTKVGKFPVKPSTNLIPIIQRLDLLGQKFSAPLFTGTPSSSLLQKTRADREAILHEMVGLQEELDWSCYELYGLLDNVDACAADGEFPPVEPGQRAFEIVLARKIRDGLSESNWFDRHSFTPSVELPTKWPESYGRIVQRRIQLTEKNRFVRFLEKPEFKRRWEIESWEDRVVRELLGWLLDRIEGVLAESPANLVATSKLADQLRQDPDFQVVAELYTGRDDYDLTKLVTDLVMSQDAPYLSALRYKPSGLRKRAQWEKTWELQRREDQASPPSGGPGGGAKADVGKIPVPPKYKSSDFQKSHYWSLRGKLDVPKERFISYPLAERDADPTPVIGWAGWDHLEQAKALASYYLERKDQDGWEAERLTPLLAGLLELVPWLKQWHNDIDSEMDVRLGDFYEGFLNEQARSLGLTLQDLRDWRPPAKAARRGRKKKS